MSDPVLNASPRRGIFVRAGAALFVVLCLTVATGFWMAGQKAKPTPEPVAAPADPKAPTVGGQPLFATWPQNQKPELVLVLTGQTYGYLSPCGCSRPQKGGLERRANFIQTLRDKGSPVVGLDLGDVAPPKGVHKQNLLKYKTTMFALKEMGYAAVGLGEYDFASQLFELLSEYALNNSGKPPIILGANLVGVQERGPDGKPTKVFPREEYFTGGPKARPMVEGIEVFGGKDYPAVGVVGVVGPEAIEKIEKQDAQFAFLANPQFLPAAIAALAKHPLKPELLVLMYGGKLDQAKVAAAANPQFQVVLCQSDDPEPPQFPTLANGGKTMIIQVGHKGQNVGALGVFKKPGGGVELKYQLVPLGEEYLTPNDAAAEKNNKVLQMLEEYASDVKAQNLLADHRTKPIPHSAQIQHPTADLKFVGSESCAKCHPAEAKFYETTNHSHAYDALVKVAKRPSNRQFDGECIVCHTVGFEYASGFENAEKTPQLKNVGCESCHGPGSGHVANPNDLKLRATLSPWKSTATDVLPSLELLKKLAAMKPIDRGSVTMPANQIQLINAISSMCMKCHDTENDPKFDFYEYYPKVYHSGLKAAAK